MYPEVITNPENAREVLSNLAGSYLYMDILESGGIRKPEIQTRIIHCDNYWEWLGTNVKDAVKP